jgi:hypothetical protein
MNQHSPEPIDSWLADRHHDLLGELSRSLDADAGLREIELHAEHGDLLDTLDNALDVEAGLAAIVPPPPPPSPDAAKHEDGPLHIATVIAAASPAVRLGLRNNPVVLAVILSDFLLRAFAVADALAGHPDDDGPHRARALDLMLDRDLARAHGMELTWKLGLSHYLARAFHLGFDQAPSQTRDIALCRALDRALDLNSALEGALQLAASHGIDFGPSRKSTSEVTRTLSRVLNVAPLSAGVRLAALAEVRPLAHVLDQWVTYAAGQVLGVRRADGLATVVLDGDLDDFTHADLTGIDLTGIDLAGVRWADPGTRWPPGTDMAAIRLRSREVAPETGVYEIGARGNGNTAHQRVPV